MLAAIALYLHRINRQLLSTRNELASRLQQIQHMQDLAIRDSLTGLYNRRHFDEVCQRELERARRKNDLPLQISLAMTVSTIRRIG